MKPESAFQYEEFLTKITQNQWRKIGLDRRAGVAVPLFSIYSKQSIGIGEVPDLSLLVDWCALTGMSIVQLLPINDVGFDFRPYDSQSSFAIDPIYLSLDKLVGVNLASFQEKIQELRTQFPAGLEHVNYDVKAGKLKLLYEIFLQKNSAEKRFFDFSEKQKNWLHDYALFKALKENQNQAGWEHWEEKYAKRDLASLQEFEKNNAQAVEFQEWLQWQIFEQFRSVKEYAQKKGVLLMGDLPFLVSRDSGDVWAHQDYFKLEGASGAPPDFYNAMGQRWGMPPYNWQAIESHNYDYLIARLQYAQNFFDLFRIDHVIGVFRLWSIPVSEPLEKGGLHGAFDPPDESVWEDRGRKLLSVMIENTKMLPCGEDLGVVPECSFRTLAAFSIPGMDVQRWVRNWEADYEFKAPEAYRKNSVAILSTHDMTSLKGWWEFEAGTVDETFFARKCHEKHIDFAAIRDQLFDCAKSLHGRLRWHKELREAHQVQAIINRPEDEIGDLLALYRGSFDEREKFLKFIDLPDSESHFSIAEFIEKTLARVQQTASIFAVQLLQDWLSLDQDWERSWWDYRINFPGTMGLHNWSLVMPYSLEKMLKLSMNKTALAINQKSARK